MAIEVVPFEGGIAAEIKGLDLSKPLDRETFEIWNAAHLRYPAVLLRDQHITVRQQIAASKWFGELEEFPDPKDFAEKDLSMVLRVSNVDRDSDTIKAVDEPGHKSFTLGTSAWHTDSSYRKNPSKSSLLYAIEIPPEGGGTSFADLKLAFEALPVHRQKDLLGMEVIHDFNYTRVRHGLPPRPPEVRAKTPPVTHPLVITLPDGAKALFLGSHIDHIVGMEREDSDALLAELTEWGTQPRFVYEHEWAVGDLVMWDNLRCMHRALTYDLVHHRRLMHRTTIVGDGPPQ